MKPKPKQKKPQTHSPIAADSSNDFAFQLTKIAVSQICQSLGFKSTQLSALENLTQVTTLYLKTLAKAATSYSNASNRTQSNVFDIVNALHDIYSIRGFTGGSTIDKSNSLLSSCVSNDLSVFVHSTKEIPFFKAILREGNTISPRRSWNLKGTHIPMWLPEFPDEKSYVKCKENNGDERMGLWENSELERTSASGGTGNKEKKKIDDGGDLPAERGRVRFRIGQVAKRNWVSRSRVDGSVFIEF
ncbi:transcription initiation factor TFIID subunit 8 [Manihot esculenta]|uniref:Bromodomain associated domain-containing protein n=1 Tax=Manihot esculenta TaxID=3983 RepID=A0A2C9U9B6_MANES|nr:transcription initiation factor TFIID subunit 8 [Manihot esculenta]OAY26586.1 hypothetical protein MANES_16G059100v8 [Manihot esculenta]